MSRTGHQPTRHERMLRLLNRGADLLRRGRAREAIPFLERALQVEPGNVAALINLGGAYVMVGLHREAVPLLEAARDAEPGNPGIWTNLGAAYLGNPILATPAQQLQAISAFERALELNPLAPSVSYNLGLIWLDRGKDELAIAAFRRALQVDPSDRDARLWLQRLATGAPEADP